MIVTAEQRRLTLVLLFGAALFNYADRYMLGILVPDMKRDLNLSDTQIGFITGTAFTLFYATLGIPIARLADRMSRKTILAVALAAWSAMTALSGLAQNFWQAAVTRVLVGVGEAGCAPPSHSLITDYYPKEQRASAFANYILGSPVGLMLGFMVGGWLTENYGWRVALFAFGIPGIAYAAILYAKLKDVPRGYSDGLKESETQPPLWPTLKFLMTRGSFVHCALGTAIHGIVYLGLVGWVPSFFARSHGMSTAEIGIWLSLVLGIGQVIGIWSAGLWADHLAKRDARWYPWLSGYAILIGGPLYLVPFLWPTPTIAMIGLCIPFLLGVFQGGPVYTVVQGVAGPRMRAVSAALLLLIINVIGGGIGPQVIGIMSDVFAAQYGDDSLRYTLLFTSIVFSTWAWVHFQIAARTVREDLANAPKE